MNIDESCCDRPSFCDLPFAARILACHQPSRSPRVHQLTDPQFRFSTTADSPRHSQSPFVRTEPAFMDHDIVPEAQPRAQRQVLPQPPGGSRVFSSLAVPCEFLTVLNEEVGVTVIYKRVIPPSETRGDVIGVEAVSAPSHQHASRTPGAGSISPYRRISPHLLI